MRELASRGASEQAMAAMLHPVRAALIMQMTARPASASALAEAAGVPVEKARYHLRVLVKDGVIEVAHEKHRRGVVERYYVIKDRELTMEDPELAALAPADRRRLLAFVLKAMFNEARTAFVTGAPSIKRRDEFAVRVPMWVDRQGWDELAAIHREAFERVLALREEAERRVGESGEKPIRAGSILLSFAMPDQEEADEAP
jgi:predicted transcriptional regulator